MIVQREDAPHFSANSWSSTLPVLISLSRLAVGLLQPYVAFGLLGLAVIGYASVYCAAAGAVLLGYLCLFDKHFGVAVLGHSPPLQPGLYCKRSPRTEAVVSMVPALRYPHYEGTPWVIGGDLATIFPYLAFYLPAPTFIRRWLSVDADGSPRRNVSNNSCHTLNDATADDIDGKRGIGNEGARTRTSADHHKEAIALDLALPEGGLDASKPFYVVLHGLNGGSAEAYVLDFTNHALERGSGVCVMVTRGCMGTPVRGEQIFHGARMSDARATVKAIRQALPFETPLAMVGYSMGGIIAANYATRAGADSGLNCCVSMSGIFDSRPPLRPSSLYKHSLRVWQPVLAKGLKENFVMPNRRKIATRRARGVDLQIIDRCKTVVDIDTNMVAPFFGYTAGLHFSVDYFPPGMPGVNDFYDGLIAPAMTPPSFDTVVDIWHGRWIKSVEEYYIDMSAAAEGKISGLKTPLLAVSALDDPIMISEGSPVDEIVDVDNLFFLLTRKGGHVGWPMGWLPWRNKWLWMSSTALDFCEAIAATDNI